MKARLLLILYVAALSACSTHYHRIDGDGMILGLRKPEANRVVVFCSLDGFNPRPADRVSGRWEVKLPADKAFKYFYTVDDILFLPDCSMKETDDFGSENCIFDPHL